MKYLIGVLVGTAISLLYWFSIDLITIFILGWYDNFLPIHSYALVAINGIIVGIVGVKIGESIKK